MKKAVVASAVLLGIAILVTAAGIATFIWSARRSLEDRETWINAKLQAHSARAAALQDLDWPPYREYLQTLRGSKSEYMKEILEWRDAGRPMSDWSAACDVGFNNRHWPFLFGLPPNEGAQYFLQRGPVAQDFYRGGGFYCSLFRTAEECSLMCQWRGFLERERPTASELDQCVEMIDRLEAARPSFRDELEVEHLLRCRDVLRIYRTSKDPERLIESQKPGWRSIYSRAVLFSQLLSRLEDQRERSLALESLPVTDQWRRLVAEPHPPTSGNFRAFAYVEWAIFRMEGRSTQRRQLLRAALAVSRYGAENGRHPDRLEDLVPKYLRSVPRSPLTGAALAYENGTVTADVQDDILQKWTVKAPGGTR